MKRGDIIFFGILGGDIKKNCLWGDIKKPYARTNPVTGVEQPPIKQGVPQHQLGLSVHYMWVWVNPPSPPLKTKDLGG